MDTVIGRYQYRPTREYPSFSSSLLDEIYRSIDEQREDDHKVTVYRKTTTEKQSNRDIAGNNGRAYLVEKWMDKEVCEKVVFKRRSQQYQQPREERNSSLYCFNNSSSSSSGSSCGGGFSSSEAESVHAAASSRPKPKSFSTGTKVRHHEDAQYNNTTYGRQKYHQIEDLQQKPKHEGKFVKTKSKAMKIYGDLKKAKQPISPGGRLSTFLNSLFTTTTGNNTKNNTKLGYDINRKSKSTNASTTTCSSASSFSRRSCLSKTPSSSSRGKLSNNNNNNTRSVRFYGDESNSNSQNPQNLQSLKFVKNPITEYDLKTEKNRKIEEAARNLLRNYQKKVDQMTKGVKSGNEIDMKNEEEEDDDDDDDDVSNASSDLFELENFSAIGMEKKYRDELPVYETTHLDSNFAIGDGFFM